jgi:superfamily II DNA or RNA helicase
MSGILPDRNSTDYPLALSLFLKKIAPTDDNILQYHQRIVRHYFTHYSDHRGLLVFHGTGTGKTMLAISIADVMKNNRRVIILSAKSLQQNFKKEIEKFSRLMGTSNINEYKFVSSNAGNMSRQIKNIGKRAEELDFEKTLETFNASANLSGSLLIVDEAQNLFNGIVNGSKNATELYGMIMKAEDIKLIFLSATPIINDLFEIVPMFNMLRGQVLLPEEYATFYELFVDKERGLLKNRDKLKNRIYGYVSYTGDWWSTGGVHDEKKTMRRDGFPDQLPTIVERVPMSHQQYSAYAHARELETKVTKKKNISVTTLQKPKSDPGSTYRVASRQLSNFLLPDIAKTRKINSSGIIKDIGKITNEQLTNLEVYSPKMKCILENISKHIGLCVVYSSFVSGEGLAIFSMVLKANMWREYDHRHPKRGSEKIYASITGQVPTVDRTSILKVFTNKRNKDCEEIDLLLLSGAGAEGLDLRNIRSIHIMEPYWNYGRIEQIIARAVRYKSHVDIENLEERTVQPYIYLSDYPTTFVFRPSSIKKHPEKTTDVHLYYKSIKNKHLIDKMYATMIEASIDCTLHHARAPDNIKKKISCLMCKPSGAQLYHPNVLTDLKLGNPCEPLEESTITATEIVHNGNTYYYTIANGVIHLFTHNDTVDAYVEMDRSHPDYSYLVEYLSKDIP